MAASIHTTDHGTKLRMKLVDQDEQPLVGLDAATYLQVKLLKPDGTELTKTLTVETPGSGDGWTYYDFVDGDITASDYGLWWAQPVASLASGLWHGETHPIPVKKNLF